RRPGSDCLIEKPLGPAADGVGEDAEDGGAGSPRRHVLSSLIILISLTMLGVVIPVSERLASGTLRHQTYDQIFYLYMHFAGLVFLAFISLVIYRFKEPRRALNTDATLQKADGCSGSSGSSEEGDAEARVALTAHLPVPDGEEAMPLAALGPRRATTTAGLSREQKLKPLRFDAVATGQPAAVAADAAEATGGGYEPQPAVWVSVEGINLYLRLGQS
uniref:Otopetrin 1 n=1 Tax=Macrostomum lignano TaxID=282301 RepID=A0A1I8FPN4_9PLAT